MTVLQAAASNRGARVLLVSGAIGAAAGVVLATWQVAVETAQVTAGLVHYPPDNPFFIYHVKLFTLLHPLCAALLYVGLSETAVSICVSGLMGMLSFQALATIVYALSRHEWLAVAAACAIAMSRVTNHGVVYPIQLLGTTHTYGAIGLSFGVLGVALVGAGWLRSGALLIGLAPAIHPSIGLWLVIMAAATIAWQSIARDEGAWRTASVPAIPFLLAGAAATAAALAVFLASRPALPPIDAREAARYLAAFVRAWDVHRRAVNVVRAEGVWINLAAPMLAFIWLKAAGAATPPAARVLLRFVMVSGVAGLALGLLSWVPPDRLPAAIVILMPARALNVEIFIAPALLIGLIGSQSNRISRRMIAGLAAILLAGGAAVLLFSSRTPSAFRPHQFGDPSDRSLFSTAAAAPGLLLAPIDEPLVQLRTRRPVLVDAGSFDTVPYALEGAPETDRIFREVYGFDIFHPPDVIRTDEASSVDFNRGVWEAYSTDRWRTIRRDWNVTQVLVPVDWRLALPAIAASTHYCLYMIPN